MEAREAHEEDLEELNELYNHYVRTSPATFDLEPTPMAVRREWFAGMGGPYKLFVAIEDGTLAGYAYSGRLNPRGAYETSITTSVYVGEAFYRKGVGTRLYEALFTSLVDQDLHRAYAGVTMPNDASVALHEGFGFKRVAYFTEQGRKFDRYWDVAWFEKPL